MASPDPTDQRTYRWLPFVGALQFDLRGMVRSRVVQGWLALTAFVAIGTFSEAIKNTQTAPDFLGRTFAGYILVWSTVVIVISAGAISAESGVVADSILSRGITRYAYIFSKYLSRLFTALFVCAIVLVPLSYFSSLHLSGDVSVKGVTYALLYVLIHISFLTILGVTFSIWFDRAIVGIAVLWGLCYAFGAICNALDIGFMAPMRLVLNIREALNGHASGKDLWKVCLAFGLPSIFLCAVGTMWFTKRDV